jgi:RNA polymerase sigma-54 factor
LHIIGSLDDDGYLRREVNNITDDLAFSQNIITTTEKVEEILRSIQSLDPSGIGARSLQECLYLQLERIEPKDAVLVLSKEIIKNHFEAFSKKHYDKIIAKLEIDEEYLKEAIEEIIIQNLATQREVTLKICLL